MQIDKQFNVSNTNYMREHTSFPITCVNEFLKDLRNLMSVRLFDGVRAFP